MKKTAIALAAVLSSTNIYAAAGDEYGPVYELRDVYLQAARVADWGWVVKVDPDIMPTTCSKNNSIHIHSGNPDAQKDAALAHDSYIYGLKLGLLTYSHDGDDCYMGEIELIEIDPDTDQEFWLPSDMIMSQMVVESRLWAAGCPNPMRQGEMLYQLRSKPLSGDVWATEVGQMKQMDGSVCATVYTHVFRSDREYEWKVRDIYGDYTGWVKIDNPSR